MMTLKLFFASALAGLGLALGLNEMYEGGYHDGVHAFRDAMKSKKCRDEMNNAIQDWLDENDLCIVPKDSVKGENE